MGAIKVFNFSQNLASAAIAESISFGGDFILRSIEFAFSASLTDTITVSRDNIAGTAYDSVLTASAYSGADTGFNTYGENYIFLNEDKLIITSTSSTAAIVYGTVIVEMI